MQLPNGDFVCSTKEIGYTMAHKETPSPVVTFVDDDTRYEPVVKDVRNRTCWIQDGKGGSVCFDVSEVNDLIKALTSFMASDGPAVEIVDMTKATGV